MRPATATSADGPFNIYQAVALAADDQTYDCGVVSLFSSTIYSARDIAKINNYKIDAFSSLNDHAALGYMRDAEVFITSRPVSKHTIHSKFSQLEYSALPKVGVAVYCAGAPAEVLERLGQDCDGLVVIGTGSGNYSQAWRKNWTRWLNKVWSSCAAHGYQIQSFLTNRFLTHTITLLGSIPSPLIKSEFC